MKSRSSTVLLVALLAILSVSVHCFGVSRHSTTGRISRQAVRPLFDSSNQDDNADRLRALGYSEDEIRRSSSNANENVPQQPEKVRVDLVEDVDSFSLTAIGFAAIALNFFVLANLGDGGIGGVVATIINTMNQ